MQYFKRLKAHPGVPVATALTIAFVMAGFANETLGFLGGLVIGLAMSIPMWGIVLWTARTQPLP